MSKFTESEGFKGLKELFTKFKNFHFNIASKLPYGPVSNWIAFADNRMEDALKEKRGFWGNVKDNYVICILNLIIGLLAVWWAILSIGLVALAAITLIVSVYPAAGQALSQWALVGIVIALLSPLILITLRTTMYYVFAKLLGGKGSFTDTMSVLVYDNAALLILSFGFYILCMMIIGFLASAVYYGILAYVVYLIYKGTKQVHKLSTKRAIIASMVPFLIEVVVWVGIFLILYFGIYAGLLIGPALLAGD